jgi:replication factor C small subunit
MYCAAVSGVEISLEPLLWCVKYRPTRWDDFVGQERAIGQLEMLAESKTLTNMIFFGSTGTGKSAAAEVFSQEILGASFGSNHMVLNVRDVWDTPVSKAKRTIQDLAKIERGKRSQLDEYMSAVYREAKASLKARGKSGEPSRSQLVLEAIRFFASTATVSDVNVKILVLDEADALSFSMQQALRRTMEMYSDVCRFILITPTLAGWSPAVLSRCNIIRFPSVPESDVEALIQRIAKSEHVKLEESGLHAIARESNGDMRRAVNLLQIAATANDVVDEDTVYENSETVLASSVRSIITSTIDGDYETSRNRLRWLLTLEGFSPQEVCLEIERDIVRRPFDQELLSRILDRIAEIDHRMTEGKNAFIHLTALLASIRAMTAAES